MRKGRGRRDKCDRQGRKKGVEGNNGRCRWGKKRWDLREGSTYTFKRKRIVRDDDGKEP